MNFLLASHLQKISNKKRYNVGLNMSFFYEVMKLYLMESFRLLQDWKETVVDYFTSLLYSRSMIRVAAINCTDLFKMNERGGCKVSRNPCFGPDT